MKKTDYLREIGKVNIDNLKKSVKNITDDQWNEWKYRQEVFDSHSKTKTYPLIWSDRVGNVINAEIKNKSNNIWNELFPLIRSLEKYYDGVCIRIMFVNLPSKEKIIPHIDASDILKVVYRCHLPIQTNSDVIFYIDNKPHFLKEGFLYEFNNQIIHGVSNNSSEDRIHLILDIIPNSLNIKINFSLSK